MSDFIQHLIDIEETVFDNQSSFFEFMGLDLRDELSEFYMGSEVCDCVLVEKDGSVYSELVPTSELLDWYALDKKPKTQPVVLSVITGGKKVVGNTIFKKKVDKK